MHTFLIDTNVASYLMKLKHGLYKEGSENWKIAHWYNQTLTGSNLAISFATKAELERGLMLVEDDDQRTRIRGMLDDFFAKVTVCQSDERVSQEWARLGKAGQKVQALNHGNLKESQLNDLWIAATAIAYNLPLVGHDTDFLWMQDQGLTLIRYPAEPVPRTKKKRAKKAL